MFKVIVLADDFTGANDTGVQLAKYGYPTITILEPQKIHDYQYIVDAIVIDTETRTLTGQEAYRKTRSLTSLLDKYSDSILYKKIDSTLRGNISMELRAMNEILKPELIVFAPAFPKNERTTLKGIHYIKNTPVDKTELSKDPKNPVVTSNIKELLEKHLDIPIKHLNLQEVRQDLNKTIQNHVEKTKILSFDAVNDDDLKKICDNILKLNKKVLWVGSAGLADALIQEVKNKIQGLPTLTVAGSVSQITRQQIKKALQDPSICLVKVDIRRIFSSSGEEITKVAKQCLDLIRQGKDVILSSAFDEKSIDEAKIIAKENKKSLSEISDHIADTLSKIAFTILDKEYLAGLFLTGGDTAVHVISNLAPEGFRINKELEPGIPEMTLLGGPFHSTKIVTKAGAFGNEDSILNSIKFMRGANI